MINQRHTSEGPAGSVRWEACAQAMGTVYRIVAYADKGLLEPAVTEALEEAKRLDWMLSNYRPESELSQLNLVAARRPVKVSDELFELLSTSLTYSRESEGAFDITVGPLMKAFGFYRGTGRFPNRVELQQAMDKVGYWKVSLDPQNRTVHFDQAGVELDPGGIGKGYAVEKMAKLLRRRGIGAALVLAGGSTLFALGAPPEKAGWKVTIRDPHNPSRPAATVTLKNEALSTSGNYEKFFWAKGKIWSHIMDPRTGYPATGMLSVSVIAPTAIESEAWTKPYYILGGRWIEKHKPHDFRVFYCEDTPGAPCAWVD